MLNNTGHFRIVARPKDVESRFSLLVVDGEGKPHLPLTRFYDHIVRGLSDGAARTYLNTLLPYFRYLSTDEWRRHRGDQWDSPPEAVQESVRDYLVDSLACKVQWRDTYEQVFLTARSPSTVRVFLCALKLFYQVMRQTQCYPYPHPLLDSVAHVLREIEQEQLQAEQQRSRMPQESGVEEPMSRRSSENYFRLVEDEWVAQPIDNPKLHAQLVEGFKQARISLRDQIVIRIAYESGARIGEILQLTVGDWRKRGMKQEALACSKGSRGRRIKTIRFHMTTAKMLREYINTARAQLDQTHRRLDDLSNADPLFLSQRRKPYSYEAFKPHWYRLCTTLKIDLNIHGLRHWYITQEMLLIVEQTRSAGEFKQKREELVRYMAWRNPDTIKAYEHIFSDVRHANTQDQLHRKWYEADLRYETQGNLEVSSEPSPNRLVPVTSLDKKDTTTLPAESEHGWDVLLALGGSKNA